VQGIKLVPPYVFVVAGPVIALFPIPPFERVKHLCGDAPRLRARQIHRFDPRAYTLMGEFVGVAQNPALAPNSLSASPPQPITLLTSRTRITLSPEKSFHDEGKEVSYVLPPIVSRLRAWTHRTSKPAVVGPSGTRGVWIQRPTGAKARLIAWTAARDMVPSDEREQGKETSVLPREDTAQTEQAEEAGSETDVVAAEVGRWPGNGAAVESVMQGWNGLPRGRARKVDLYPVKVEDVKRVAFDEGTGRTCLGMRNGEVHVLDFA
jgi:hypothetical protein